MSKAAISIFTFGCYLVLTGATLIVVPNLLLGLFGVAPTQEVWIRVLGVVAFVLGLYYIQAGRNEVTPFFRWTTWGRALVLVAFVAFVLLGMAPAPLIVFGIIDAAGGLWTALALRQLADADRHS